MMRQPDNHPYKVLMKKAFTPTPGLLWTRGALWKGVLLMVMIVPAAVVNINIPDLYKKLAGDEPPAPVNPNLVGPGHRPVGVPQGQPNPNPNANFAGGQNPGLPGFNPQGIPNQNPAAGSNGHPGFPPQGNPAANQGGNSQVFLYTVRYESFTGEGSVKDAALAALKIHPDFPEDSLKVDEEAKTIQFQYKVRIAPPALASLFASRGFRSLNVQMSSQ